MLALFRSLWQAVGIGPPDTVPDAAQQDAVTGATTGIVYSGGFALRSLGAPYFCMLQQNLQYMDVSGGVTSGGDWALELTVAFHALPIQFASPSEEHALFSLAEHGITGRGDLLRIGITPAGAIFGGAIGGTTVSSSPGLAVADGKYHRIVIDCTNGGTSVLTYDGFTVGSALDSLGIDITPTGLAQWMLFNGAPGITRCDCSIRSATFISETGSITWNMGEGDGRTIGSAPQPNEDFSLSDFTLTASYYDSFTNGSFTHQWGSVPQPGTSLEIAYRWELAPNWQKVPLPKPKWTRRAS